MVPAEGEAVVVLVNAGSGTGFGETGRPPQRRHRAPRSALDYAGGGSRWSQKALFVGLVLLPSSYLLEHGVGLAPPRRSPRQDRSLRSVQPVVPAAHHARRGLGHARPGAHAVRRAARPPSAVFQPDFGLLLLAGAVTGVLWAVLRLGVASTRTPGSR